MKKLVLPVLLALALLAPKAALAERVEVADQVTDRYATIYIFDSAPSAQADKKAILKTARDKFAELGVADAKFAVYEQGKTIDDGPWVIGELTRNKEKKVAEWIPSTPENLRMLVLYLACEITAKELWKTYEENEVVADEDFSGRPFLIQCKKTPGLQKDFSGTPYVSISTDDIGLSGVRVNLAKNDPKLREMKKGKNTIFRIVPKSFVMGSVMCDGVIVLVQ
ncbi:MAG: hypothetical protein Q4F72_02560 [Desulfovibrionaceae bacterium]|nr:hypothetical protein [Desulfovibrionaceae bacterium]